MTNSQDKQYQKWSERLQQFGLHQLAASFLEASGPLNLIASQLVIVGQPIINGFIPDDQITTFSTMLENPEETTRFVDTLREELL